MQILHAMEKDSYKLKRQDKYELAALTKSTYYKMALILKFELLLLLSFLWWN